MSHNVIRLKCAARFFLFEDIIIRKNIFRFISVIIILTFLWQDVLWAIPNNSPQSQVPSPQLYENIYIPEQYGRIEKSVNSPKQPMVVLMKDAHCNYEAQKNIERILDILIRDYKIDLVCVEGANGILTP